MTDALTKAINNANVPAHIQAMGAKTLEEFTGGITSGMPLPMLSIRGKVFRARKDGQEVSFKGQSAHVVLVAARKSISKRYYEGQYVSGEITAPTCSAADGLNPDVPEPIAETCTKCPYNAWGSAITQSGKKGKKCSDYKRLVIWVVGTDTPFVMDLPATSLKAPKDRRNTGLMMYADYVGQLAKHQMDPTTVVTTLEFTDAEYPQLAFNFERYVDEAELKWVQEMRAMAEVEEVLQQAVFEGDVSTTQEKPAKEGAAPAPAPEPPPEPAKPEAPPEPAKPTQAETKKYRDSLKSQLDDLEVEYSSRAATETLEKLLKDAQEQTKMAAPQTEPAPEANAPAADEEADVMNELRGLLGG